MEATGNTGDQSISKFVVEMVEDGLVREEESYERGTELIKKNKKLKEGVKELSK